MARKSKSQRLAEVHEEALLQFNQIQTASYEMRRQARDDRRFYSLAGAQWEGTLNAYYENRPRLEVNKIHLSVMRIINEYRNNRISVNFISRDGDDNDELVESCASLYRATEQDSVANEAYDNAFEEAVGGGYGAFRLRTEYEDPYDEENEYQCIRIEPIFDADSTVYFDLNAKRQDKADAERCYVLTAMTRESYVETWGDDPATWPQETNTNVFDWATADVVYVAEVYCVEEVNETIHIYQNLDGTEEKYKDSDFENDENLEETLEAIGSIKIRQRKVKCRKVHKYIMSGASVLEDCGYIAGTEIPIVPVYGKRWVIDNIERCAGQVRYAKDAQRLKNMQLSKLAEITSLSSYERPIFTPDQIAGHEVQWVEGNLKNFPFQLINPIIDPTTGQMTPTGPVGYTKPPNVPPALAALMQTSELEIKEILGSQEAGEDIDNSMSGRAIELVQNRLDMQSFIYLSNMTKAVQRCGQIWLSMARDVFVESGRRIKGIGPQDEVRSIQLSRPMINQETGGIEYANDMANAKFDVVAEAGPSSSSKRAATVRTLTEIIPLVTDPETQQVLTLMTLQNIEGEGIIEAREYARNKLVRMGVVEPTESEQQELAAEAEAAAQQPDPQAQYLEAASQEAIAKAQKAQADTALAMARAEETQAKTAETLAGIDMDERKQAVQAAKDINEIVQSRNGGMQ